MKLIYSLNKTLLTDYVHAVLTHSHKTDFNTHRKLDKNGGNYFMKPRFKMTPNVQRYLLLELFQGQGQVVKLRDILISLGDSILSLELFDLNLGFVERFHEVTFPFLQSPQRDAVLLL